MTRERVSLYFNTEIPLEKAMWDYINKDGKKSYTIKKIIEQAMNNDSNSLVFQAITIDEDEDEKNNIIQSDENEEIDLSDVDDPCC